MLKGIPLIIALTILPVYSNAAEIIPDRSSDAYVTATIGDARILIPFLADDMSSSEICSLVYNGLTKTDKDLNVIGDLAEKWEISEDGLNITFFLKKNVKWHDGVPFTASDVKFTFETILNPATGCPYISGYQGIENIDVIDDNTIAFVYKEPYAPALLKLGMGIIPEHLFRGIDDIRKSIFARVPVGTGPYKFVNWSRGQHIILEANKDYFEHVPGIKRYVYRIIPDQSVQFLELIAGSLDSIGLTPYQYKYRSDSELFKKRMNKYLYTSTSYTYIGYNLNDPILKDKNVRMALDYAINKEAIINGVLLGLGSICSGPFRKDTPFYDKNMPFRKYNIERSRKLLKEAGWEDTNGNGIIDKDGMEFIITLITNQGNQVREDVATIVERQWSSIGIKTDVQVIAWPAFLGEFIDKRNFQAVLLAWFMAIDPDCYAVWHSESMKNRGLNFISYSNKEVDRLIEEGRSQFDPEKRKLIYNKIHKYIYDDVPYSFLYFPYSAPAIDKRFEGIEAAPAGIGYNFIDWHVPDSEVKYKF